MVGGPGWGAAVAAEMIRRVLPFIAVVVIGLIGAGVAMGAWLF